MAKLKEITVASKANQEYILFYKHKIEHSENVVANYNDILSPILGGKRMWNYPCYYLKSYTQNSPNKMAKLSKNITQNMCFIPDKQANKQKITTNVFQQKWIQMPINNHLYN